VRVKVGGRYVFRPCTIDRVLAQHHGLQSGEAVRVVQLHGAPKPNTMGHCHVERADGSLAGMVSTDSLFKE